MPTPHQKPADESIIGSRDAVGFVLRLGRALHVYGIPAHRLEEVMEKAAERLGLQGQFFSTPTAIFASFGRQDEQRTFLMRVTPGEVNLGKIAELDDVTTGVLRGALDPAEGSKQIDRILAEPHYYGAALTTLAFSLASAAASRFLGGGLKEIAASALIGLVIGLLSLFAVKYQSFGQVFEFIAAGAASALAASLTFVIGAYAVSNATLAGLIALMPGLTLTIALIELSTRNLSSGTSLLVLIRDDPFYPRHPRSITTCADSKTALNLSDHDRELQPPVQFQQKLRFSSQVCWRFIELMYRIWREHTKKRK